MLSWVKKLWNWFGTPNHDPHHTLPRNYQPSETLILTPNGVSFLIDVLEQYHEEIYDQAIKRSLLDSLRKLNQATPDGYGCL